MVNKVLPAGKRAVDRGVGPALNHQIVTLESRMTAVLGDQIAGMLLKDLKLEIVRHLADAKTEIAGALPEQIAVAAAVEVRPVVR